MRAPGQQRGPKSYGQNSPCRLRGLLQRSGSPRPLCMCGVRACDLSVCGRARAHAPGRPPACAVPLPEASRTSPHVAARTDGQFRVAVQRQQLHLHRHPRTRTGGKRRRPQRHGRTTELPCTRTRDAAHGMARDGTAILLCAAAAAQRRCTWENWRMSANISSLRVCFPAGHVRACMLTLTHETHARPASGASSAEAKHSPPPSEMAVQIRRGKKKRARPFLFSLEI